MLEDIMMNEYRNHVRIQENASNYRATNSNVSKDDAAHKIAKKESNLSKNTNAKNIAKDRPNNEQENPQQNPQPNKQEGKSNEEQENEKLEKQNEDLKDKKISEYGQTLLENGKHDHKIHLLSIIGEIEGHECLPQHNKTTKYEHVLPQLAAIEDSNDIDGLLILINTVGGDVEAGLAIAEMIASLSKPTVSLVLGGSHSIGVPLAVSADYSFIVPSATMIIHPVRMNGMVIGVTQTFEYFEKIQDRIINFVVNHSRIDYETFRGLMLDTKQLAKDVGSILVGAEAVEKGIIDAVGGIKEALDKINEMIDARVAENSVDTVNESINNEVLENDVTTENMN
mgnify:CR=1 FL=1